MAESWRWRLSGSREMHLDTVAEVWDCNRARAVEKSLAFTVAMLGEGHDRRGALREALRHEDMTPGLAETLSTDEVALTYQVDRDLEVGDG